MMEDTILEVENLRTSFATDAGSVQSVRGITFHVGKGESLGIVEMCIRDSHGGGP